MDMLSQRLCIYWINMLTIKVISGHMQILAQLSKSIILAYGKSLDIRIIATMDSQ